MILRIHVYVHSYFLCENSICLHAKKIFSVMSKDMEDIKEVVSSLRSQYVAVKLKCSFNEVFQSPRPSEVKRTESLFS